MNKSDYVFQIAMYHKDVMEDNGFYSYKDLKKLTIKEIKKIWDKV